MEKNSIKSEHSVNERKHQAMPGWRAMPIVLAMLLIGIVVFVLGVNQEFGLLVVSGIVVFLVALVCSAGFVANAPNEARALLLMGDYRGTIKETGFFWVNPFFSKKKVSLRVRNFETGSTVSKEKKDSAGQITSPEVRTNGRPQKVNDRDGNPIDIGAIVVWKVVNTAEALFEVDDYEHFVKIQSESALRNLAMRHPYDSMDDEISLRGSTTEVSEQLETDIQERLHQAGVQVIEARISHLAYSQEIAAAMLQRQQASAVVAARSRIVEGAVGMVQQALDQLSSEGIVELDDASRAQMVSNLLVVLCSDRHAQPVVNAGG
jgi:regulator of protease activity HflC (stomatin/prohibitin superfamily)